MVQHGDSLGFLALWEVKCHNKNGFCRALSRQRRCHERRPYRQS